MEKQPLQNATLILVLGILSIVTCCCYGVLGLPIGIVALVLANKSTKIYIENPELLEKTLSLVSQSERIINDTLPLKISVKDKLPVVIR